jgi:hypothetical protein
MILARGTNVALLMCNFGFLGLPASYAEIVRNCRCTLQSPFSGCEAQKGEVERYMREVELDAIQWESTMRIRRTEMREMEPGFGQFLPVFTDVIIELLDYFSCILNDVGTVSVIIS